MTIACDRTEPEFGMGTTTIAVERPKAEFSRNSTLKVLSGPSFSGLAMCVFCRTNTQHQQY